MLGEAENHEHKPIEYSTIFSENSYNGGIVLQLRKRERNSGIIKKEEVGRRLPS